MPDSAGKASVLNIAFSVVLMAAGIVINVAIARLLGPKAKGVLSVFQATQGIMLVVGYSVQQSVIRLVARQRPAWHLLRNGLALLAFILAVLLVGILFLAIQHPLGRRIFFTGLPTAYLGIMFISIWGALWFFFRSGVVDGLQQYTLFVKTGFISSIISNVVLISSLVVLYANKMVTAPAVIVATVASTTGTAVLTWILVTRRLQIEDAVVIPVPRLLALIIQDAIPVYVRDLLEWTNNRVDVFFVNGFLGTQQVGLYTVAVGLASQLMQVPGAVMGPLYARVSREGAGEENLDLVRYAFRVTFVLSLVMAAGMLLAVPLLLPLVYGNRYAGSAPLLALLLPGAVMVAPTKVAITYLRACGQLALPIRAEMLGLVLTVALNSTLIPRFGPAGAAIASSCSFGGLSLFLCYHFMRMSESAPRDLLLVTRSDARRVLDLVMRFRRSN